MELTNATLGQTITLTRPEPGLLVMEATLEPGAGVPYHRHLLQEETFSGVEGEATLDLGRRRRLLGPGDIVVVARGRAHRLRNAGPTPVRVRAELRPALRADEFFADLFRLADAGLVPRSGVPGPRVTAELAARYGPEFPWLPIVPVALQRAALRPWSPEGGA